MSSIEIRLRRIDNGTIDSQLNCRISDCRWQILNFTETIEQTLWSEVKDIITLINAAGVASMSSIDETLIRELKKAGAEFASGESLSQ
jgi:hypothetical protein